jgi:hypothetical protein
MNRSDSFDWFKVPLICLRYFLNISEKSQREQNESIADLITEGTIFSVLCDDDGHDFYLLKATSESIILQEN